MLSCSKKPLISNYVGLVLVVYEQPLKKELLGGKGHDLSAEKGPEITLGALSSASTKANGAVLSALE